MNILGKALAVANSSRMSIVVLIKPNLNGIPASDGWPGGCGRQNDADHVDAGQSKHVTQYVNLQNSSNLPATARKEPQK